MSEIQGFKTNLSQPIFNKNGENLFRLESSAVYYALLERGGKQIRKSLKTTDASSGKRRLSALREKLDRLSDVKGASRITFAELANRWFETVSVVMQPSSSCRIGVCIEGLLPVFDGVNVRNIMARDFN